jgi:polysaccharide biosynthesis/export protein
MFMRFIVPSCAFALSLMVSSISCVDPAQAQTAQTQPADVLESQAATPLKSGDRLRITVAGFPDLSGEQMIAADGTVQLPMAGAINIGRLNSKEAADRISEALLPYVRRPQVALVVISLSSLQVTVTGEVVQPGPRLLSPYVEREAEDNASVVPVTLSRALLEAGGITPNADIQNVIIRRVAATSAKTGGERTEIKVNLWEAIHTGNLAADPKLYDSDEIIIPTAKSPGVDQQVALGSTIAPTKITVQVAGEVFKPGLLEVRPGTNVSAAIAAAGGPTDAADKDDIVLYRMAANGQLIQQTYEFGDPSPPLMNGDVIVVDKQSGRRFLDVVGSVLAPVRLLFGLF